MVVVLQVVAGPGLRRKTALRAGQRVEIGRTEWADVCIAEDRALAGVHFRLEADAAECRIEDLQTSTGTFVNGRAVRAAVLRDCDEIRAGQTIFRVSIEGEGSVAAPRRGDERQNADPIALRAAAGVAVAPCTARPDAGSGRRPNLRAAAAARIECRRQLCDSQAFAVRGTPGGPCAVSVAEHLAARFPVYLVADAPKLGIAAAADQAPPDYLIDWAPDQSRARHSPWVVGGAERVLPLVGKHWGQDGLVAVFSQQEKDALLRHLREMAGVFYRPSVLNPQLQHGQPEFTVRLLSLVEAVMVEDAADPGWVIYAPRDGRVYAVLEGLD